jgi:hypothetical protein
MEGEMKKGIIIEMHYLWVKVMWESKVFLVLMIVENKE